MKKLLLFLSVTVLLPALIGCTEDTGRVSLDEEFELEIGESAIVRGEDFEITFLEVLEDSRCPKNVTCIWEGRAMSLVRISLDGTSENIKLSEPGATAIPNLHNYKDYTINFYLYPYPESPGVIDRDKYYLLLTISRK